MAARLAWITTYGLWEMTYQGDKCSSTRAEHKIAVLAVGIVAVVTEITVAKTVHDKQETAETQGRHPDTIHDHVGDQFPREDAGLQVMRWTRHDVRCSLLHAETHVWHTGGGHDDPQDLDGSEREDRVACGILEGETNEESGGLGDVLGQDVQDKTLDVVEKPTTFLNGVEDGREIVISQNDVRCLLCNVATSLTLSVIVRYGNKWNCSSDSP